MNEELLTLLIKELIGKKSDKKENNLFDDCIGKYVLVRTRNEGVNAGFLEYADEFGCILEEARRLHYHKPLDSTVSWYEGVAKYGISDDSRLSTESKKIIVESYSLTICSDVAKNSMRDHKSHEQR